MKFKALPVMPVQCKTCPFRVGIEYEELREYLSIAAITEGRICHSTGRNAIHRRTGKPPRICRGARDQQLQMMAAMGVIESPTDEAWAKKVKEMGL